MAIDAGDDRADWRQVDVVIGMDVGHVGRIKRVVAMRTGSERGLDRHVRVFRQGTGHARAAGAGLLVARLRPVRLLALRGRHAGVVGGFGRVGELGFQFGDAPGQSSDLLRMRLHQGDHLLGLRLDHGDQVIAGEAEKGCAVHASS